MRDTRAAAARSAAEAHLCRLYAASARRAKLPGHAPPRPGRFPLLGEPRHFRGGRRALFIWLMRERKSRDGSGTVDSLPSLIPEAPLSCATFRPSSELEEFRRLKPRLTELWNTLALDQDQAYTSVVIPSLTLDERELEKLEGRFAYYEERLLFMLIRLRNPHARMVYVTSRPVHPLILEYYFELLAGSPGEPRPRAPDASLRLRRLAAFAHGEDPGTPAPDPEDPIRHRRPRASLPVRLQRDPARAEARRPPRDPVERRRPGAAAPRHEVGKPARVP